MQALVLLIFIGVIVVSIACLLFLFTVSNQEYEHLEETSLLPLDEDESRG